MVEADEADAVVRKDAKILSILLGNEKVIYCTKTRGETLSRVWPLYEDSIS